MQAQCSNLSEWDTVENDASRAAAIWFEPEDFAISRDGIMGRHAASRGFLDAAIQAASGAELFGWSPNRASAEIFAQLCQQGDAVRPRWVHPAQADLLASVGALHVPGPNLAPFAHMRLRADVRGWSLTGVTHTTASHEAMDDICGLIDGPVFPWDALVCTSRCVHTTVRTLLDAQKEYARWRFGATAFHEPQLPIIPLGVHLERFEQPPAARAAARASFALGADDVCLLYHGRLSLHAKAHPHALYAALEEVAAQTGRSIVLLHCGWFANAAVAAAFKSAAAQFCPLVRAVWADGQTPATLRRALAAADLFVSLADNIQETFGLTPLEAMAAGLPTVVSDWNGYKETVVDGVTGYRVETWMPGAPAGETLARAYEAQEIGYDRYIGYAGQSVAIDQRALVAALRSLVEDSARRAEMGAAGRRAAAAYAWPVIFRRYQALWSELACIRRSATTDDAPRNMPGRPDPFASFGHYPTHRIEAGTWVRAAPGPPRSTGELRAHPAFSYAQAVLPPETLADAILRAAAGEGARVEDMCHSIGMSLAATVPAVAWLAKTGHVRLQNGPRARQRVR